LEEDHKARWRRHFDRTQKTHICRVKAIVKAIIAKQEELGTIVAALEWTERVYKDECRKTLSNLETWLKDNGLVEKRANRGRRSDNGNGATADQWRTIYVLGISSLYCEYNCFVACRPG
jgi:hypothetical protein